MILTDEQKHFSQEGKKFRSFDKFGNHWDIVVKKLRYHPEGYLWVEHWSMKNDSGEWIEDDGSSLEGLILEVQNGNTIEID